MSRKRRIEGADPDTARRIVAALDALAEVGPGLGRPLVDTIRGSSLTNLKELRVGTARILFVFDRWRSSILLVAGDKTDAGASGIRSRFPGRATLRDIPGCQKGGAGR